MAIEISSLPKQDDEAEFVEANIKEFTSQQQVQEALYYLVRHYYMGEIVPRDDNQVVKYLSKLMGFYQQDPVENEVYEGSFTLLVLFLVDFNRLSEDNPLADLPEREIMASLNKIAIEAGSTEIKSSYLMLDFFKLRHEKDRQYVIDELQIMAEQGSRGAVQALAEIYDELAVQDPEKFDGQKQYWQQKESQLPLMKQISWN